MAIPDNAIRHSVVVPLIQSDAFRLFTDGLASWWPAEYTWSQGTLVDLRIEPRKSGRCTEQGPYGFECDWGRVLEWSAPEKLVITWQIGLNREPQPDPEQASTVIIDFRPETSDTCSVTLEHRNIERHGQGADEYQAALSSDYGWPFILHRYVEAAKRFDR
ncbi:SRPBCC family protein [Marinobacter fonticola]|uniref:SRPBCC family protein n=1 Tax=Marinobacter fonticola TaxID=2603215 RepID=UPI00143D97DB|nr:SRPBCC family protein [Marinobacter fonticola]